ncbi:MAG: endolytic transglycosylase MltG [Actinobacteria bacterium]|nr:endolytic transglycosylase MltG [Actinomycetota bacterium]
MALSRGAMWVLVILVAGVVAVGGGLAYVAWSLGGEPGEGAPVSVEIAEGSNAATVAQELEDKDVVRSAMAFRLKARSRGLDRELQAGTYDFETGMSVDQAIDRFLAGPRSPASFRFTIPEGWTVDQILARLAEESPFSVDEYRAVLDDRQLSVPDWVPPLQDFPAGVRSPYEGLLFPETYEFSTKRATPQAVLQRMVDELTSVVDSVPDTSIEAAASRGYDRYEVLVIASLIEEEVRVAEERALVSGVIHNRLEAGQPLQVDAANIYAVGEHTDRVAGEYLTVDSPYNLYQRAGLPPTPIASPGSAAIEAAFSPADTDYLYYVIKDEEGRHAFAETFQEHQRNKAEYERLRERPRPGPTAATPSPDGS